MGCPRCHNPLRQRVRVASPPLLITCSNAKSAARQSGFRLPESIAGGVRGKEQWSIDLRPHLDHEVLFEPHGHFPSLEKEKGMAKFMIHRPDRGPDLAEKYSCVVENANKATSPKPAHSEVPLGLTKMISVRRLRAGAGIGVIGLARELGRLRY